MTLVRIELALRRLTGFEGSSFTVGISHGLKRKANLTLGGLGAFFNGDARWQEHLECGRRHKIRGITEEEKWKTKGHLVLTSC